MKNKTVYIIEDDEDVLQMLSIALRKNGYKVIPDYNGDKLDLSKPTPSLYLVDYNLKGKNGIDICHKIKLQQLNAHILLMSANPDVKEKAAHSEADGFIAKPFDMQKLLNMLKIYSYCSLQYMLFQLL